MKQTMTMKREYERPTMQVVRLKHRMRLLEDSRKGYSSMRDYTTNEYVEE